MSTRRYTIEDFDFALPAELIAQFPAAERAGSRLLVPAADGMRDLAFRDLPQLLSPGDLLVVNQTRVVKARLFGTKDTGGKVELLIERVLEPRLALAHIRASHAPRPGARIHLAGGAVAEVVEKRDALTLLRLAGTASVFDLMEAHGALPLPPYIAHPATADDEARYQTVYASTPGAVAAPTAGLHFDAALFAALAERGIARAALTLHVGAGTFQPVRVTDIAAHVMHSEWYEIPEATAAAIEATRAAGGRIVAVGTTTLRALEAAAARAGPGELVARGADETRIFITPGFTFRVVDRLITNFHLPKSTLMMLVSAFAGHDLIRSAYAHAVRARYRFFSYGDAMLLARA
ncbi:MAG: tRNA preQ1(34) S-adenosylmethionine ribosyltransferase-isomerase QueA [Burkholderiales bacterium]|nr:tRNA preQ1(34) S-adenosylmethionine ribosyltransferase-isomerase QueA [Burkholderiales bacterium]